MIFTNKSEKANSELLLHQVKRQTKFQTKQWRDLYRNETLKYIFIKASYWDNHPFSVEKWGEQD